MAAYLRLHPTDNVVVAVADLSPGDIVDDVKILRRIPRGHKAAVRPIAKDTPTLKFGQIIGFASGAIGANTTAPAVAAATVVFRMRFVGEAPDISPDPCRTRPLIAVNRRSQ